MKWLRDFRFRLLMAAVLPALLLTAAFAVLLAYWTRAEMEASLRERVEAVAHQIASATELQLYAGNFEGIRATVDGLVMEGNDIVAVAIVDADGRPVVARGDVGPMPRLASGVIWEDDQQGHGKRLLVPIEQAPLLIDDFVVEAEAGNATPVGYVLVRVSLVALDHERNRLLGLAILAFLMVAVVGGLLAVWLARGVSKPLGHIVQVVHRIGHGDPGARVEYREKCVLSALADGINDMAARVAMNQDEMRRRIDEATHELQTQKQLAEREARIDPLTGLYNRRAFFELAEREVRRVVRHRTPLALVMLDLDHFKTVNDIHGHPVGDQVLIFLAEMLRHTMREIDVVGRLGGEEFVILMPDAGEEAARQAAERLREALANSSLEIGGVQLACTASFGVALFDPERQGLHDLLVEADHALYRAKHGGRNRVEVCTGTTQEGNHGVA